MTGGTLWTKRFHGYSNHRRTVRATSGPGDCNRISFLFCARTGCQRHRGSHRACATDRNRQWIGTKRCIGPGRLLAVSVTLPENPLIGVTVTVSGALDPWVTENDGAEIVKLGAGACGVVQDSLEYPLATPALTALTT